MEHKINKDQIRYAFEIILEPYLYDEKDIKTLWRWYKEYVVYKGIRVLNIIDKIYLWYDKCLTINIKDKWLHNYIIYDIADIYRGLHHINHFMFHFENIINQNKDIDISIKETYQDTYIWLDPLNKLYEKYFLDIEILIKKWLGDDNIVELPKIEYYIKLQNLMKHIEKERNN